MSFESFSSFTVLALRKTFGVPATKIPVDGITLISYIFPPVACYVGIALLAVTPQTRVLRAAMWPLVTLLALRAVLSVDMSQGRFERRFLNVDLVLIMITLASRSLEWAIAKGPFLRRLRPANSSPSTIMDALDLASNFRGHGWEWSPGLYIPLETRPANRMGFIFYTFLSGIAHTLICGALQRAILTLAPPGVGSIYNGSTIFDNSLPFLPQYLRAYLISIMAAFSIYAVLQMGYDWATIPAILILGQDPAQWPPVFKAPWLATSLSDFWARRWHQMFRSTFLFLGGYPLSFVFGRAGIVIGAFLVSAILHHIAMLALDSKAELRWMLIGFGMMGPGVLAERAFQQLTGRRVGGMLGWVWTMSWLIVWGTVLVEGFARAGMFASATFLDSVLPVQMSVEPLVINFDAWLHTI